MKKLIITTILLTIWAGISSQENLNQINHSKKTSTDSYNPSTFEDYVAAWAPDAHVPGLSMALVKNGEIYWVHHWGYASLEQEKLVHDSSSFYSASISKPVVQTAAMQLWEQDYFELDDDVSLNLGFDVINYPYCPDSIISYFHLMTHTSSIRDNYAMMNQMYNSALAECMEGYFTQEGEFYSVANFSNRCPGDAWEYTNIGAALLGYLTEAISGVDYNAYCIENVFNPLEMYHASYDLGDILPSNRVNRYTWNGSTHNIVPQEPGISSYYPAGGLRISAIDFAKFLAMYLQDGTLNGNTILNPETIDLILSPTAYMADFNSNQCLIWLYSEDYGFYYHTGGTSFASSILVLDRDDQWGVIMLMNVGTNTWDAVDMYGKLEYFASLYNPISLASIQIDDTDGDQVIEANEEINLGLALRCDKNYQGATENIMATISVNSPYITLVSDSVVSIGTLNYLEEIQLPSNQFVFEVSESLEPGNVEFQLHFTWDNGGEHTTNFELFAGHADVLLVRDEESASVCYGSFLKPIQEYYLESLDSLGFMTHYKDVEIWGDLTPEFLSNFPAVIWFTGNDTVNTLSANNQTLLSGYLDNGGQLFLSGQNISDELAGSDFLENYLHTEHIQDTWYGSNLIKGIENDPIGNGQNYPINTGDALEQYSGSVIEPLDGAYKSFGYNPSLVGAVVRYENDTYKTLFFAIGFEAINGLNKRTEILGRIMNDYFEMPQSCLPEGIIFTTQEEIDNFQINHPGCTEIEGDVTINGDDITNLEGLSVLTAFGGNVLIGDDEYPYNGNPILENLTGLDNLASIGGDLSIGFNDTLSILTGLENLVSIGGNLVINGNAALTSLTALEGLITLPGDLTISGNGILVNLTGLDNITSIAGDLNIGALGVMSGYLGNSSLINLTGLNNLNSIAGDLYIGGNDVLENLAGLESLTSILGNLKFGIGCGGGSDIGNPSLESLAGVNNLTFIGGSLVIRNCPVLTSLAGLDNLTSIGGGLFFCYIALVNLAGLEGLTSIDGNLWISDTQNLTNLTGLENLTSFGGSIYIYDNNSLVAVTGLENLTSIGGVLSISGNSSLTSLSGLANIDAGTIENISIWNNNSLSECHIQSICDYLAAPNGTIKIYNNAPGCNNPPEIAQACGNTMPCLPYGHYYFTTQNEIDNFQFNYPGCAQLEGDVSISGNDITNLYGLDSVTSIAGNLLIRSNDSLTILTGLEGLASIGGNLHIKYNHALSECDIQSICDYLAGPYGAVYISYNAPGCNSKWEVEDACESQCLYGGITFTTQEEINNFQTNYPGCTEIEGDVEISGNDINSLEGLSILAAIDGYLNIHNNPQLIALTGLENIEAGTIESLAITNNENLSSCHARAICDYLTSTNPVVEIHDNAEGCDNPEEIVAVCYVSVEETQSDERFSIFPNPFTNSATLEINLPEAGRVEVKIYNQIGQLLKTIAKNYQNAGVQVIDLETGDLEPGVYFCVVKTGEGMRTVKMIKL